MALYRYKAVSPQGETLQGEMDAGSPEEVVARLQEAGNVPINAEEAGAGGFSLAGLRALRRGVSQNDIVMFTQQMATLLGAGLPLDRALSVLTDLAENERMGRMVADIRDRVRGGTTLSEALESQHGVFSRLYVNMVRAGEVGGSLDETLARLGDYLGRSQELKESVLSALIYPILLLFMAGASLLIMLVYVVPQFMPLFEELGSDLPMLTRIVLAFGYGLQSYWWLLLLMLAGLVWFMRRQLSQPDSRYWWHDRFLRLKLVGDLLARVEVARLSRTLGTLLRNGVPMLSALSISRNVVNNAVLKEGLEVAATEVKTGGGLAHTLAGHGRFPHLALQMISVGEETGQLDGMLLKVADVYDHEVKVAVDRLLALLVPVMILVLAVIIAVIILSILMAILSANQLVA